MPHTLIHTYNDHFAIHHRGLVVVVAAADVAVAVAVAVGILCVSSIHWISMERICMHGNGQADARARALVLTKR